METSRQAYDAVDDLKELGLTLRAARAKVGMTRRELADKSGTSERYLAQLESGAGNPSLSILRGLALALDVPLPELLPDGGERDAVTGRVIARVRRLPEGSLLELERSLSCHTTGEQAGKGGRIALIGLRGAGKSTLGPMLAQELGCPFLEMTKEVEVEYGGSMGVLLEIGGQSALRRYENEVWDQICARHEAAVIALPGSIVADPALYDRILSTAHSVWLQADPEDHMERVMSQGDFRPMANNRNAMADLKAILGAREADYQRADLSVQTSGARPDESLRSLLALLRAENAL